MTEALRILFVVPFPLEERRGNSVSSARHAASLRAAGHPVEVVVASDEDAVRAAARDRRPDVVHAIHAFRAGPVAARAAAEAGVPLIVSFRGTDSRAGLEDASLRPLVERAVASAARVTALTVDEAERVLGAFPALRGRVSVVTHAVEVPEIDRAAARRALGFGDGDFVVAHVAGIRRVKGFPDAWSLADALHDAEPAVRYVHAGPLLEPDLGPAADAWFAARPWTLRLGAVPRDDVLRALAAADVSFHASFVEGLSNALLESMALGTVPLARDIPASRAAVTDGVDGLLFRDTAGAVTSLGRLRAESGLSARLRAAARRTVAARFSSAAETAGYLRVYGEALAAVRSGDGEVAPGT